MSDGFDFGAVAAAAAAEDEGTVVHIHDRLGKPMYYTQGGEEHPVIIRTAGKYSQRFRRKELEIRRRPIKAGRKLTAETFYEDAIEKAAACAISWEGFTNGGAEFECNARNAAALYSADPNVFEQVSEAMDDPSRFFETPSPTSAES